VPPLREVAIATAPERRRWFCNDDFDLFVWFDDRDAISWFELCYDRSEVERALTWSPTRGYAHFRVSTGDAAGMDHGMTPILVPDDTEFPKDRIIDAFGDAANTLEPTIRAFVVQRLQAVPGGRLDHWRAPHDPAPPPEREIVPGRWSDPEPAAWRPTLIAAAIAIGLALAVWLLM
jgi:hypothetical protein